MKKTKLLQWSIITLLILQCSSFSYALSVETHEDINEYIARTPLNGFSFDLYLRNNLGIQEGVTASIDSLEVWQLLRIGGRYEDKPPWTIPYLRSVNHFHNPLTDEGYSGIWGTGFLSGMSSTQWVLMPQNTQSPGGYYSWNDVRDYYFRALTSTDQNIRNSNFAETFRGLGQLMHLVQDASVPAHTRDDGHLLYNYEKYAESYISKSGVPAPTSSHFFNGMINDITSFIDTSQYDGNNPNIAVGNTIGLSEYTSANFFSEDTIDSADFTFPRLTSAEVADRAFTLDSGGTYTRHYYLKVREGETNNDQGYLLAAVDWLEHYRQKYPALSLFLQKIPVLDDNVYKDYASLLLPRAVGYSADLIDYFFRGKIDFAVDDGDRVDGVKGIKVLNLSNEDMDGTFSLYYDAVDGSRYLLGSWTLLLSAEGTSPVLSFSFPENNIELHRYILVFRGRMGMETDAVAGYIHGAGWKEEWYAGLYDNHNWVYSETDLIGQNPNNGTTINNMSSGKLVKENNRYAGSDMARINENYIGVADDVINGTYYLGGYAIPYDFTDRFPMQVNSDTWLSLKIDAMSINEHIPAQSCGVTEWPTGDYQGLSFEFRLGDGSTRKLVFTASGHESYMWPTILVQVAQDYSINVYDLLVAWGGITEPVYLDGINIIQQMLNLCSPSSIEHRQHMEVDYIRIEKR